MGHVHARGWWEQADLGRQYMDGLIVSIENDHIEGSGSDMVGLFVLTGSLSENRHVVIDKQYLGKHRVSYSGQYDGVQRLWGRWRLAGMEGPWEIVIKAEGQDDEAIENEAVAAIDEPATTH
ncbi:MAG: hypothetical protein R2834_05345 [Rhodothermales bacterium]